MDELVFDLYLIPYQSCQFCKFDSSNLEFLSFRSEIRAEDIDGQ